MKQRMYSSNAYGYIKIRDSFRMMDAISHIAKIGYDGFDLLYGVDSYPPIGNDLKLKDITQLKNIVEENGVKISSIVLVSFELNNIDECIRQLDEAMVLAKALNTSKIHLLPRKVGITHDEGFKRFEQIWTAKGEQIHDSGMAVSAENHIWFDEADKDIFLIRNTKDFMRMSNVLGGRVRIKFDPAWLLKAGDELMPSFIQCLPFIDILDTKDFADGKFVTPGTGRVDFEGMAEAMTGAGRDIDISVEVEEHLSFEPTPLDPDVIDELNKSALRYYKTIFK